MTEPAEPRPACPICRRPRDDWHVCPGCVTRVDTQLRDLLDLHAIAAQPGACAPGRAGDPGPMGARREPPLPVSVAILDIATGEEALGILEGWVRWWSEWLGFTPWGERSAAYASRNAQKGPRSASGHGLGSTATSRTLAGAVGFLVAHWPRMAHVPEPPPDEFADEVAALHRRHLHALALTDPPAWTVTCPTDDCGNRLRIEHDGREAVLRCWRCGVVRTTEHLLYVARAAGQPCWLDAEAAARALHCDPAHLGPMVRDGRLRSRGERDCRQYDINSLRHADNAG